MSGPALFCPDTSSYWYRALGLLVTEIGDPGGTNGSDSDTGIMVAACLGGSKRYLQNGKVKRASHYASLAAESNELLVFISKSRREREKRGQDADRLRQRKL